MLGRRPLSLILGGMATPVGNAIAASHARDRWNKLAFPPVDIWRVGIICATAFQVPGPRSQLTWWKQQSSQPLMEAMIVICRRLGEPGQQNTRSLSTTQDVPGAESFHDPASSHRKTVWKSPGVENFPTTSSSL